MNAQDFEGFYNFSNLVNEEIKRLRQEIDRLQKDVLTKQIEVK